MYIYIYLIIKTDPICYQVTVFTQKKLISGGDICVPCGLPCILKDTTINFTDLVAECFQSHFSFKLIYGVL